MDKKMFDENLELVAKQSYETATFLRRSMSYILDLLVIISIAYLGTLLFKVFKEIDIFIELFEARKEDVENIELYKELVTLFWKLVFNVYMIWLGSKLLYYTLIPAILGNGRTLGKLVAGIGVLDKDTLEEVSPSKLMLREFIGRVLVETVLFIPNIVSILIAFFREDSRSLHDLIAGTVVIKLEMYDLERF